MKRNFSSKVTIQAGQTSQTIMTMHKLRWLAVGVLLLGASFGLTQIAPPRAQAYTVVSGNPLNQILTVTGTGDTIAVDGVVTLREAVTAANTNAPSGDAPAGMPGLDTINFNLPGAGVHTIHVTGNLPIINDSVVIDGYTQPGASVNTRANGDNAVILIELEGSGAGNASGFNVNTSGCTIRGLAINRFATGSGIILAGSNNFVTGNFIGLDAAGTTAQGNFRGVILALGSLNNTVGGLSPALRNVISGNSTNGVITQEGSNILRNNTVAGNFIGTDASGLLARPNQNYGIAFGTSGETIRDNLISGNGLGGIAGGSSNQLIGNSIGVNAAGNPLGNNGPGVEGGGSNTTLGGTTAGAGNLIAYNSGVGVSVGGTKFTLLGNAIFANGSLGIDLNNDGVTPNDAGDADTGANNRQNFPVLTSVNVAGDIQGTLDSLPANTAYPVRIEFFANTACDASGNGEGEVYLGFISVNAPGNFAAQFTPVAGKPFITATATDANGNTSEFSVCKSAVVCQAITINPASLPGGQAGAAYTQTLTASGGSAPYAFALEAGSSLPNGLTLTNAGLLSGTPAVFGNFNFTVKATDANGCTGTRAYPLTITAPCAAITVNPTNLPNGTVGTAYNQTATATGGTAPYAFTVSAGALPGGLTLNTGGALTGTPNAAGVFNFTLKATDANGCFGTRAYTVTINSAAVNNGLQFYPLPFPLRLLDTRAGFSGCDAPGAPLAAGTARTQIARRTCNGVMIPANALAVTGNVTTVQSGGGYLTLYPSAAPQPLVANTNYGANEVINNVFTVGLGNNDGAFKIFALNSTEVVVDITGYYAPPAANGLYFHPLPQPVRLLDTRVGQQGCYAPGAPFAANTDNTQPATGACNGVTIPATALALVGNATTVSPQSAGYLTFYPANAQRPLAASSNFSAGQIINAPFTVGLSPAGAFKVYTTSVTDLVIDVAGYYSADANDVNGAGLLFNPLPAPVRLLETRAGQLGCYTPNAPLLAGSTRNQQARGVCNAQTIAANAQAIVGNATVVNDQAGYLTFWPNGAAQPLVAASNFAAGQVLNRHFTVGLGATGMFNIFTSAQTDMIIDVSGFFAP